MRRCSPTCNACSRRQGSSTSASGPKAIVTTFITSWDADGVESKVFAGRGHRHQFHRNYLLWKQLLLPRFAMSNLWSLRPLLPSDLPAARLPWPKPKEWSWPRATAWQSFPLPGSQSRHEPGRGSQGSRRWSGSRRTRRPARFSLPPRGGPGAARVRGTALVDRAQAASRPPAWCAC